MTASTKTRNAAHAIVQAIATGDPAAAETARTVMAVARLAGAETTHITSVMLLALHRGYTGERRHPLPQRELERVRRASGLAA